MDLTLDEFCAKTPLVGTLFIEMLCVETLFVETSLVGTLFVETLEVLIGGVNDEVDKVFPSDKGLGGSWRIGLVTRVS